MAGAGRQSTVPLTIAPKPPPPARLKGMTISVWLALGFALVIGAFAVASVVALRSTRHATVDLAQMQQQFEPLSRSVRDLGDGLASFDRAVLAYLRADTTDKRTAAITAAQGLSLAANRGALRGRSSGAKATIRSVSASRSTRAREVIISLTNSPAPYSRHSRR